MKTSENRKNGREVSPKEKSRQPQTGSSLRQEKKRQEDRSQRSSQRNEAPDGPGGNYPGY